MVLLQVQGLLVSTRIEIQSIRRLLDATGLYHLRNDSERRCPMNGTDSGRGRWVRLGRSCSRPPRTHLRLVTVHRVVLALWLRLLLLLLLMLMLMLMLLVLLMLLMRVGMNGWDIEILVAETRSVKRLRRRKRGWRDFALVERSSRPADGRRKEKAVVRDRWIVGSLDRRWIGVASRRVASLEILLAIYQRFA